MVFKCTGRRLVVQDDHLPRLITGLFVDAVSGDCAHDWPLAVVNVEQAHFDAPQHGTAGSKVRRISRRCRTTIPSAAAWLAAVPSSA